MVSGSLRFYSWNESGGMIWSGDDTLTIRKNNARFWLRNWSQEISDKIGRSCIEIWGREVKDN